MVHVDADTWEWQNEKGIMVQNVVYGSLRDESGPGVAPDPGRDPS